MVSRPLGIFLIIFREPTKIERISSLWINWFLMIKVSLQLKEKSWKKLSFAEGGEWFTILVLKMSWGFKERFRFLIQAILPASSKRDADTLSSGSRALSMEKRSFRTLILCRVRILERLRKTTTREGFSPCIPRWMGSNLDGLPRSFGSFVIRFLRFSLSICLRSFSRPSTYSMCRKPSSIFTILRANRWNHRRFTGCFLIVC